jgi:hypothetical protein
VKQLALDFVDLPPFASFDEFHLVVPGRGMCAAQPGLAPIAVGFEPFPACLQPCVQLGDRAGKPGLKLLDFPVDLAVDSRGVQGELPSELIRALCARLHGAFEAVEKFERFLETQVATHNRS